MCGTAPTLAPPKTQRRSRFRPGSPPRRRPTRAGSVQAKIAPRSPHRRGRQTTQSKSKKAGRVASSAPEAEIGRVGALCEASGDIHFRKVRRAASHEGHDRQHLNFGRNEQIFGLGSHGPSGLNRLHSPQLGQRCCAHDTAPGLSPSATGSMGLYSPTTMRHPRPVL